MASEISYSVARRWRDAPTIRFVNVRSPAEQWFCPSMEPKNRLSKRTRAASTAGSTGKASLGFFAVNRLANVFFDPMMAPTETHANSDSWKQPVVFYVPGIYVVRDTVLGDLTRTARKERNPCNTNNRTHLPEWGACSHGLLTPCCAPPSPS